MKCPSSTLIGLAMMLVPAVQVLAGQVLPMPGDELWVSRYDFGAERPSAIVASPDGSRVFVTGHSSESNASRFSTVAIAVDTGEQLWATHYIGPINGAHQAQDIAVSPDGDRVFVTGPSVGDGTGLDYATVAYDAITGAELWVRRYDGPGGANDRATGVVATVDKVFVTGGSAGSDSPAGADDYATVAYDAATGDELWVARYDGPAEWADQALALDASPNGGIIVVTGYSFGVDSDADYATVAYDAATGDELWVARYDGPAGLGDNAIGVAISPLGDKVFVTGHDRGQAGLFPGDQAVMDYATVAYDLDSGEELWVSRYDGPGGETDNPRDMGVSPDGSVVYVTGYSHGGADTFWDFATIAYSAETGQELWVARHNNDHANAQDIGYGMAVTDTRVFVTGRSLMQPAMPPLPASDPDFATVAYDATTGEALWVSHYNGPPGARDNAFAMVAVPHPLGYQVIVTGESEGHGTGFDYATVSYIDVDPAMYPVLDLAFDEISATLAPGDTLTLDLTIGNPGGTGLEWAVFEDTTTRAAPPPVAVTRSAPSAVEGATLATSPVTGGGAVAADWPAGGGDTTLSHSLSTDIMPENSAACVGEAFGQTYTLRNRYLRTFSLDTLGIASGFEVTEVSFGIEVLTGVEQVLLVNLYDLRGEMLSYDNMHLVGTAPVTLSPQSSGIATVPVSGRFRGGATLVVEIQAPDVMFGGTFFIGSNNQGQTAPSYLSTPDCGLPEPTDLAALDWPDMHVVMSVTGFALPACDVPDGVPWVQTQPLAGTVDPHGTGIVEVTLDADGLAPGAYPAHLCLASNDPWQPWVMVPLTLSVEGGGGGGQLQVTPNALDFGQVVTGTESPEQVVSVTNIGGEPVQVESVATPQPPFNRGGGDCPVGFFGFVLAPGESCTLAYVFLPEHEGGFEDSVEIISDAPGGPHVIALAGQGVSDSPPSIAVEPEHMVVILASDQSVTDTLTIANLGTEVLEWTIAFSDGAAGRGDEILWDQAANSEDGYVSTYYVDAPDGDAGTYGADDFVLGPGTRISEIHTPGWWGPSFMLGSISDALAIHWFIYPDDGGVPAGHPDDGQNAHVWSYSAAPGAPGVILDEDGMVQNVTLDVTAATGAGIELPEGHYWLLVYPEVIYGGSLTDRWNRTHGVAAGHVAMLVDPTDLFGFGATEWMGLDGIGFTNTDYALTLRGSSASGPGCEAPSPSWLNIAPLSGTVAGQDTTHVDVTFDATGLAAGEYTAELCVGSNDPDNGLILVPVALTVIDGPDELFRDRFEGKPPAAP